MNMKGKRCRRKIINITAHVSTSEEIMAMNIRTLSILGNKNKSFAVGRRFNSDRPALHQTIVPERVASLQVVRLLYSLRTLTIIIKLKLASL